MIVGDQIWISIPNSYHQMDSYLYNSLSDAAIILSVATNGVTTTMIAYKLWYVAVGGFTGSRADYEVILQELPYIHREASRLEWAKESRADHIDSSH